MTAETFLSDLLAWTGRSSLLCAAVFLTLKALPNMASTLRHRLLLTGIWATLLLPPFVILGHLIPRETNVIWIESPTPILGNSDTHPPLTLPATSSSRSNERPLDPSSQPFPWEAALLIILGIGTLVLFIRLLISLLLLHRKAKRSPPIQDAEILIIVQRWKERLHLRRNVHPHWHPLPKTNQQPMAWGLFRLHLALPATSREWSKTAQEAAVAHELAHHQRQDCASECLSQLLVALQWWNPLIWILARELRQEREHACDDLITALGIPRQDYADTLLKVAASPNHVLCPSMAKCPRLEARLKRILTSPTPSPRHPKRSAALLTSILFLSSGMLAWFGWADESKTQVQQRLTMTATLPTIILDPGHGGQDTGAIWNGIEEADLNLAIAKHLKDHLLHLGAPQVILTRQDDTFLSLNQRAELIHRDEPTLALSLHVSSAPNNHLRGSEIFYGNSAGHALGTVLQMPLSRFDPHFRGLTKGSFTLLNESPHPTLIIEAGFLSHPEDREQLQDEAWIADFVDTLAQGLLAAGQLPVTTFEEDAEKSDPVSDPTDLWFRAYRFTKTAEERESKGNVLEALAKYQQAQRLFDVIALAHPTWKEPMLTYRRAKIQADIDRLQQQIKAPAPKNEAPSVTIHAESAESRNDEQIVLFTKEVEVSASWFELTCDKLLVEIKGNREEANTENGIQNATAQGSVQLTPHKNQENDNNLPWVISGTTATWNPSTQTIHITGQPAQITGIPNQPKTQGTFITLTQQGALHIDGHSIPLP